MNGNLWTNGGDRQTLSRFKKCEKEIIEKSKNEGRKNDKSAKSKSMNMKMNLPTDCFQ